MSFLTCLLCSGVVSFFVETRERHYYRCRECHSVMLDPTDRLNAEQEKQRYNLHQNNPDDSGYQKFLEPLITAVAQNFSVEHKGLDYGSGPIPAVTMKLKSLGYDVTPFDPYFQNDEEALARRYDFIVCCETAEHFYNPYYEFQRLRSMLNPQGKLILLTALYDDSIDFKNWHYKNDPTHVFFYSTKAFEFIRRRFDFTSLQITARLIELSA
jgi:hypothetical protein